MFVLIGQNCLDEPFEPKQDSVIEKSKQRKITLDSQAKTAL